MKLAIWTESPPKLRAIEQSSKDCVYFERKNIELLPEKVESWVSDMPISLNETILWAKNRAINISKITDADFYIWMEGWTTLIWEKAFLFGCICIIDSEWKEHLWLSPMMELPWDFQTRIYDNWEDLGPIMEEISWELNAKKKSWAFWHYTDGMLTRKTQFSLAFTCAISPFFNKYYK